MSREREGDNTNLINRNRNLITLFQKSCVNLVIANSQQSLEMFKRVITKPLYL